MDIIIIYISFSFYVALLVSSQTTTEHTDVMQHNRSKSGRSRKREPPRVVAVSPPTTVSRPQDGSVEANPYASQQKMQVTASSVSGLPPSFIPELPRPMIESVASGFAIGDLDSSYDAYIIPDITAMFGTWDLLLERSESTDAIMSSLGVSGMKRAVMRNANTALVISDSDGQSNKPSIKITTRMPMNNIKTGVVYLDGQPFQISDSDTGPWTSVATIANGRLYQKRVSSKGTMYDVRATLSADPLGRTSQAPLHVFKWTFIDKSGKKNVAHRFFSPA